MIERFRATQKEDDRGPLSIQSSLGVANWPKVRPYNSKKATSSSFPTHPFLPLSSTRPGVSKQTVVQGFDLRFFKYLVQLHLGPAIDILRKFLVFFPCCSFNVSALQ